MTTLAISPCPNDTFVFHALVTGLVPPPTGSGPVDVTYADIDVCNRLAREAVPDVVKISVAALPWVSDRYRMLDSGGAVGHGCGPLVLVRPGYRQPDDPAALAGARVAIPGELTTAYLLLRLWLAATRPREIVAMPFEQIMPAVRDGVVDAGLVIHEARFTYHQHGLVPLVDLGAWWEADTGLPVPLGVIVARDGLDVDAWSRAIRSSVDAAWADPRTSSDYVRHHAQETADDVTRRHIETYVNEFTRDLGPQGHQAIARLLGRAGEEGLVPQRG